MIWSVLGFLFSWMIPSPPPVKHSPACDDFGDRPAGGLDGKPLPVDEAMAFLDDLFCELCGCIDSSVPMTWRGDVTDLEAELEVFESVSEIYGGEDDGKRVYCGYILNVDEVREKLDAYPPDGGVDFVCDVTLCDCTGPHIAVVGSYKGVRVTVTFCANPPCGEEATWVLHKDGSIQPKEVESDD